MKHIIITIYLVSLSFLSVAQWSNDPAQNTPIALASGEEAIPKIATTQLGETFVSWFSKMNFYCNFIAISKRIF